MKNLVSRRRFELLALSLSLVMIAVHFWADALPVKDDNGSSILARAIHTLEGRATDLHFKVRGPQPSHPDVAIVVIDEKSVQKFGLWPWPRSLTARLLTKLHEAGVAAIGMDAFFPDEAKDSSGVAYAEALKQLNDVLDRSRPEMATQLASYRESLRRHTDVSPDAELALAFAKIPEIVQGVSSYGPADASSYVAKEAEYNELVQPALLKEFPAANGVSKYDVSVAEVKGWPQTAAQMPLAIFAKESRHFGHFNVDPDPDGILRRIPLLAKLEHAGGFLPSLALETAAVATGATVELAYDPQQGKLIGARLRRPGKPVELVPFELNEPYTHVNYLGSRESFHEISAGDVLDGNVPVDALKGKAVLFGVNLVGLFDQRATPFNENEAGIYVHASMLSNILSNQFLTRPPELRLVEILFMLGASLLMAFFLPRLPFVMKIGMVVLLAGGWVLATHWLFASHLLQLATVMPTANVLVSAFGVIFLGYLSVDREKGVLRSAFQHYLNESVMEQMLQHPEKLKLGGEKREMTVLFSDIRGFTTLSERMAPEALVKFINSYLTPMTRIVFEEGGTLDKYIGDALMAFWGAPLDQPDHALRACRAAVRFLDKLKELKVAWRDQNLPEFDIGVGINSGPMIVGNMGSDIRFDYTVMGDSVNLASRLEGTNKEYETRLMISEATYLQVKNDVIARRLGAVRVKGKRKPVRIYELRALGQADGLEKVAIEEFERALDLYTEGKFAEAEPIFQRVLEKWPNDAPSRRYLEELAVLKTRPVPATWDGVYTATHK